MSKKSRFQVKANFRNKKTILSLLNNHGAINVSSNPTKDGDFNVFFSTKNEEVFDTISSELTKLSVKIEKLNG